MKILHFMTISLLAVVLGCSSQDKKSDRDSAGQDNEPSEGAVLDYSGFTEKSFDEISWERKCDGIGDFFSDFSEKFLFPDVRITVDTSECPWPAEFAKEGTESFKPKITVTRGEKSLVLWPEVDAVYSPDHDKLQVKKSEIWLADVTGGGAAHPFTDDFGKNFKSIYKTFRDWAHKASDRGIYIFNTPYRDFLGKVEDRFGVDSEGLTFTFTSITAWVREPVTEGPDALDMSKRWLTIKLSHSPDQTPGTGRVIIEDAGPEIFRELDHDGKAFNYPFFGCLDLECLKKMDLEYKIYGGNLYLSGNVQIDGKVERLSRFAYRFNKLP